MPSVLVRIDNTKRGEGREEKRREREREGEGGGDTYKHIITSINLNI